MKTNAIVTMIPYADFIEPVLRHPVVSGIRLNTVMPIKGALEDKLQEMYGLAQKYDKDLWIDLKARQLRIKSFGVPPFTEIELTHKIAVKTPCVAYFSGGGERATVVEVDGNKLIMQEGPGKVVGPGESVNIPDGSLEVEGFLTDKDKQYIEAASKVGIHKYMLSFVEHASDLDALLAYDNQANIIAKIESRGGLQYVDKEWKKDCRLMAARGDLYVELAKPHYVVLAAEKIVKKDPDAVVASRIYSSLAYNLEPTCEDIGDADNLLRMGYRTLMFGDDICLRKESIMSGLNLLTAMADRYGGI